MSLEAYPLNVEDAKHLVETFDKPDISLIKAVLFFDWWSSYEDWGGLFLFEGIDGSIQRAEWSDGAGSDWGNKPFPFELQELTMDQAIAEVAEFHKVAAANNDHPV